jgi:hypothetical protein
VAVQQGLIRGRSLAESAQPLRLLLLSRALLWQWLPSWVFTFTVATVRRLRSRR